MSKANAVKQLDLFSSDTNFDAPVKRKKYERRYVLYRWNKSASCREYAVMGPRGLVFEFCGPAQAHQYLTRLAAKYDAFKYGCSIGYYDKAYYISE